MNFFRSGHILLLCTGLIFSGRQALHAAVVSVEPLLEKGRQFQKQNKLDSARYYARLALTRAQKDENKTEQARAALLLAQCSAQSAPREAILIYHQARNLALECGERAVQFRADLTMGSIYRRETKYDSTRWFYNEAVHIAESLIAENRNNENLRKLGMVYNNFGAFYSDIDELPKAAWYMAETEKIGREIKDTGMMMRAAINAGAIYAELGSEENKLSTGYTQKLFLQKAMAHYLTARSLLLPEDQKYLPSIYNNIGVVYLNMHLYDSAIWYVSRALAMHKKYSSTEKVCNCEFTLGAAYQKRKDLQAAMEHYNQAIEIGERENLPSCRISGLSNKGQLLTELNKLDEAETVLLLAMELRKQIKNSKENFLLYEKMYLLYEKKQDYKKAFDYYRKFVYARDSIADIEHLNLLDELGIKYETEKKDEQISTLSFEKQLLQEKNRTRDAQLQLRNVLLAALLLVLAMGAALVYFYMQRRKLRHMQEATDLEHRLLRARMNPHFLFNGLNTIQKHYADGHSAGADAFLADFSKFLRMVLNKTGETKHTLADEIELSQLYVSLEQRKYEGQIQFEVTVDENVETETWMVPSMILQPLLENAIWHGILPLGKPGKISLHVSENADHELICTITDNGVGFAKSMSQKQRTHASKATQLIVQRLGKHGSIDIQTIAADGNSGTVVTLRMTDSI